MIRILVVEDDPIIAKDLTLTLGDMGYEVAGHAKNTAAALELISQATPDLIICDIHLGYNSPDGIDLATDLKKTHKIPFIFLSGMSDADTIQRAAQTAPDAYLVKPFNERTLFASIELAMSKYEPEATPPIISAPPLDLGSFNGNIIFIKENKRMTRIDVHDILWLHAQGAYTYIHTVPKSFLLSNNLSYMEEKLAANRNFIRVHRSYLVNVPRIDYIEEDIIAIGDIRIPLGKSFRTEFYNRLSFL